MSVSLTIPPGRYAVTRRRSPAPGCEGDRVYAEAQPVTLHALVSDGQRVMALVEHVDGHFETVREVDLHRLAEHEGAVMAEAFGSAAAMLRRGTVQP